MSLIYLKLKHAVDIVTTAMQIFKEALLCSFPSHVPKIVDIHFLTNAVYFQHAILVGVCDFQSRYSSRYLTDEDAKLRRISPEFTTIKPVAVRHQHRHLACENHQRVGSSGNFCYLYLERTGDRISALKRVSQLRFVVVLLSPSRYISG